MMQDVDIRATSENEVHHSVVGGFRMKRRNALIAGIVVLLALVIAVPIIVTQSGSSSSGSSSGSGNSVSGDSLLKELQSTYGRSDYEFLDVSVLSDKNSPQYKAYKWLDKNPNLADYNHGTKLQRYALASFYFATNGIKTPYSKDSPKWKTSTDWLDSSKDECTWFGIECGPSNNVVTINLEDNDLTGAPPPELSWLSHLRILDLTSNMLYMEGQAVLSVLGEFPRLEQLLVDDNFIVTSNGLPEAVGKLENLEKLRLSYNLLRGEMNNGVLDNLTKLTHLEIESNFLSGPLPPVIGTMEELVYLYMRRNALAMDLNFIKTGKLKNIFSMWLDSNNIAGTIPTEIGTLSFLASLSLTDAGLGGTIPTEIGNLQGLRRFWIYTNRLQGAIPTEMASLPILEVFEAHDNNLEGAMPRGVCNVVEAATYASKSLTADCKEVTCSDCCTQCFP